MSTRDSAELWKAVRGGDENALRELISRYVNLVYSVALHRTSGQTQIAEEIAQRVFADFAEKAKSLPEELLLGGWLHRHTCFISSTVMRGEERRRRREREASAMNLLQQDTGSEWHELADHLDDAIDALSQLDREAIILRYYEQCDLRAVGVALAITEDAAQKRVSRAVEKLRELLMTRGKTISSVGLVTCLTTELVTAAPATLASSIAASVLPAGIATTMANLATSSGFKIGIGLGVGVLLTSFLLLHENRGRERTASASDSTAAAQEGEAITQSAAPANSKVNFTPIPLKSVPASEEPLRLLVVAADSGKPIPNVPYDVHIWADGGATQTRVTGLRDGTCTIPLSGAETSKLQIFSRVDDFADTRLLWRPTVGEVIPTNYVLRLARGVSISGKVVAPNGEPVEGASISFSDGSGVEGSNHNLESHQFLSMRTPSDSNGNWRLARIAPEMLAKVAGSASHSNFLRASLGNLSANPAAEAQLRSGQHVFRLRQAGTVYGVVEDTNGVPISGALVLAGMVGGSDSRQTHTGYDGSFILAGCYPDTTVTASAPGYAPRTVRLPLEADAEPIRITLDQGRTLRIRVVDRNGLPISKASVIYETPGPAAAIQFLFNQRTDESGEVIWRNAPATNLTFQVEAKGCIGQRSVPVESDVHEHTVTLRPALVVFGTVTDEHTGEPIPRFSVTAGWTQKTFEGTVIPRWSSFSRDTSEHVAGSFRREISQPVVLGTGSDAVPFRIQAKGFETCFTRFVGIDEGEVRTDVKLRRAPWKKITVNQPDASPADQAFIGHIGADTALKIGPGYLSTEIGHAGTVVQAGADGSFTLIPQPGLLRVIIVHDSGFLDLAADAIKRADSVRLQPWGQVEGVYFKQGKPAEAVLSVGYIAGGPGDVRFQSEAFDTRVAADGKYRIMKLPPGIHSLTDVRTHGTGSSISTIRSGIGGVHVRAGQITTNDIGVNVVQVAARLDLPPEFAFTSNRFIGFVLHSPVPEPPIEVIRDEVAHVRWSIAPERRAILETAQRHIFRKQPDGQWLVHDVPPGSYSLSCFVQEAHPQTRRLTLLSVGRGYHVEVPTELAGGRIDLGDMNLKWLRATDN